ncbi:class I SAM-dependent methyltransferase [Pseudothauera rhizosphaerae]|uniref:Methyltransferase domain-containing protein n=1 Tax=Pseudothauera rhizosphaerae TaxID=2565932 RepID=A0A4V3WAV2_9RHOO|nr:class I SAM-dependent methyltransferase [Pseudothauera rhizosphaerae]THF60725.1 methyltransferase domain-containing protein [Pseudothauera rhizosphaerae]
MNRKEGYTVDVAYPAFFYKEMLPVWLSAMTRFLGFAAPGLTSPFTYCELGCGVGINLLVAAASHPSGRFLGVDFNAAHLETARDAARASGLENIEFIHADFAAFARSNKTDFDFIASHGVWSWIAPQHRAGMLDSVARHLKPGGVFYLHYMCYPGSTDMVPVQNLLNVLSHHLQGTSAQKIQAGLALLLRLADAGLFADQPATQARLRALTEKDPNHLAHEFLTDHWQPQHAVDVHQQVGEAGVNYLGSADVFNNLDPALSIPGKLLGLVNRMAAPALVETVKDLARNSHQRMDIFQRTPRALGKEEHLAQLGAIVFGLLPGAPVQEPLQGPLAFSTPIGPIEGPAEVFAPLLHRLSEGEASFAELSRLPVFAEQPGLLFQSLQLLMHQEIVHPVKPVPARENASVEKLTQWLGMHEIALRIVGECATAVRT